jgi:hypothetical protein
MDRMKILTGIAIVALGGISVGAQLSSDDIVQTLQKTEQAGTLSFLVPSHSVDVRDNGQIDILVGPKKYSLTPDATEFNTKEQKNTKYLFLGFDTSDDTVKIKDVWGNGSDIEIKNTGKSVSKVVSFTEDYLKTIPDGAEYLEVSFDMTGDWGLTNGIHDKRIEIDENVWLEKSLAWDSSLGDPENEIPNSNYIDIQTEIKDGKFIKRIPVSWLKTAVFPVYTDAVFTFGTKELADVGPSSFVSTWAIGTNKQVTCWSDNADTSVEGECLVSSISGSDLTFGSVSQFDDDITNFNSCSAGDDRWVVIYNEDLTNDNTKARVASSTGTTINGFGTASTIAATTTGAIASSDCILVDTNMVVFVYALNPTPATNRSEEAIACTINADYTLTCGSAAPIEAHTLAAGTAISSAKLDTNKFVYSYQPGAAGTPHRVGAGTVSGTTITLGATTTINTGITTTGHSLISPGVDKFAVHWTAGGSPMSLALGTVSGTTITLGATTTPIIATTTSFSSLIGIDSDSAFLMYQQGATDAGTTFLAAIPIELNFGTLTFSTSTAETIDTTTDPGSLHAALIDACSFAFVWEDDNDTNDLFAEIGTIACPVVPQSSQVNFTGGQTTITSGTLIIP